LVFFFALQAIAIEIPLQKQGGVYSLPVRINGVITLNFILDSGASEVAIPADVAMTLIRTGTITDNDFLPGKSYRLADGSQLKSTRLILREMELGGIKISNVPCSVTPPAGDLLLGQSLLEKLHSWKLDNDRHVLVVDTATVGPKPSSRPNRPTSSRGDFAQAYKDLKPSAEQGKPGAQYLLALLYFNGQGVPQDYVEAAKWMRKAAQQGLADAQYYLGVLYRYGEGVPQDHVEAASWFRRAAEEGHGDAQYALGSAYVNGEGVPQDFVLAYMWLNLAAAQGKEDVRKCRDLVAKWLTPAQIAEAQRLARERKQKSRD
jgi:clan AA aspartic protease (TIGR02281 family)